MATRVLIVDDDPAVRVLLASYLETEGYDPLLATGGADALALLDQLAAPPAILLLDLVMPDVDGYAVLSHLRHTGRDDLPILIFSGYRPDTALLHALGAGRRDFIAKPLDLDELRIRLQRLLQQAPLSQAPSAEDGLRVYALGTLRVYHGERVLLDESWPNTPAKTIFKVLLTHHGQLVARETLMETLWPAADPTVAINRLRVAIHDLRKRLSAGPAPPSPPLIGQQAHAYVLDQHGRCWSDVRAFEAAVAEGRTLADQERLEEALAACHRAATLYDGDYLREDLGAEWSLATRERLHVVYLGLLRQMAQLHARRGAVTAAVQAYRRILQLEPWREEVYRHLMRYLARVGRPSEALRVYEECRRALAAEGLAPSPPTQQLRDRIATSGEEPPLSQGTA